MCLDPIRQVEASAMCRATFWAGVVIVAMTGVARAEDDPVIPTSGFGKRATVAPLCCPSAAPVPGCPCPPTWPGVPGTVTPSEPGMPGMPGVGGPAGQLLDNQLSTPFSTQTGAGGVQGR